MQKITRLLDSLSYLQRYALDNALSINNHLSTPGYGVYYYHNDEEVRLTTGLVIDVNTRHGTPYLTIYFFMRNSKVVLLYEDESGHVETFNSLTTKFSNFRIEKLKTATSSGMMVESNSEIIN